MNKYMAYWTSHVGHPLASMTSTAQWGLTFSKAFAMSMKRAARGPASSRSWGLVVYVFLGRGALQSCESVSARVTPEGLDMLSCDLCWRWRASCQQGGEVSLAHVLLCADVGKELGKGDLRIKRWRKQQRGPLC